MDSGAAGASGAGSEVQKILPREIEEEMKTSYLAYAMSVLVSRALPDIRDGLKPVQRRVLFAMLGLGLEHSKPYKKCARIVGDCLGKYHPHGDSAVYEALVRMAQDFSLRYPLVEGQGNFGSVDGDSAAHMRYTESRMSPIAELLLEDIDKETVDFVKNFDGSLEEPVVLPSKFPNLIVNGSSGIAVGMATNIPPHNLKETIAAITMFIKNPNVEVDELLKVLPGPDFPTGAIIYGSEGVKAAYTTGKGSIVVRAKASVEQIKGKFAIIVTELPYQVNKALLVEQIANLVKDKIVAGIQDIRDESDREGLRVVIEVKKDSDPHTVLNSLYVHSNLQAAFHVSMVALVNRRPKLVGIKELIHSFVEHRKAVIQRRTAFLLRQAEEKAHLLEGLLKALASLDEVIAAIRAAKDVAAARLALTANFLLSEKQADFVLETRLQRLVSLEREKVSSEHNGLLNNIASLREILASENKVYGIIVSELQELSGEYGDKRRTVIVEAEEQLGVEDITQQQDVTVTITNSGYVKRTSLAEYRQQRRGGKGVVAATAREGDFVKDIFVANTHSYLLFFTNFGMAHWLKVYDVPESSRYSAGKAIVNLLRLRENEMVTAVLPVKDFSGFVVMATKKGTVKKNELADYSNPRMGGIIAISLEPNDELISVAATDGNQQLIIAAKHGLAARFNESEIRSVGRTAKGVNGIRLHKGDEVVGMVVASEDKTLLTVTENGFGKRSPIADYRLTARGAHGVINIQTSERNGLVAAVAAVTDDDELMIVTKLGSVIRLPAKDVSVIGRNTQGVRLIRLDERDTVVSATIARKNGNNSQFIVQPSAWPL